MSNLTSSLTVKLIDDVSKPARTVAQALEQAGKEAKRVADAMKGAGATDKFVSTLGRLKLSGKDIEAVSKAWKDYSASAKLAANSADWTKGQLSGVRNWERQTIAALREVEKEQARFAASTRKTAKEAEHNSAWSKHGVLGAAAQGAAIAVSAHSIFDVIKDAVTSGARYQHETTALQNAGRTPEEMARIEAAARDATKTIPTSSLTENLRVINETTSAFGTLNHAIENLPFMQKSASVLRAASPSGAVVDAADLGNKMARAFEERGTASNSELFRHEASEVMRAMAYSGGRFNPDELLNFAQQAKSSLQNYDLHFLSRIVPTLVGTQGGERAGTAANAFTSLIMGKANDKKQAEAWIKYGLLDPTKAIVKAGHAVSWQAGAVVNTPLALSDPLAWIEKEVLPRLAKKGVNVDDQMALSIVLGTLARNQNANLFLNELAQLKQRQRLHKDEANIDKAGTLDDIYKRNLAQDPSVGLTALTSSLENLGAVASSPMMKKAAEGISGLASTLQGVAAWGKDHPNTAVAAGVGAGAAALGGAGYLSYQLINGFGLKTSAAALDGAAASLSAAAAELGGAGLAGGSGGLMKKGLLGLGGAAASGGLMTWLGGIGTAVGLETGLFYMLQKYKESNPELFRRNNTPLPVPGHFEQPEGRNQGAARHWVNDAVPEARKTYHKEYDPPHGRFGGGSHWVEDVKKDAGEAKSAVESINTTVAPKVDTSSLEAAKAAAASLLATLSQIAGAAAAASSAASGIKLPNLGAVKRSSFSPSGDMDR